MISNNTTFIHNFEVINQADQKYEEEHTRSMVIS